MDRLADWSAVVFAIAGSTLIALNIGFDRLGYAMFMVSGIASMHLLKKCGARWSLMLVTVYFFFANVVGFIVIKERKLLCIQKSSCPS